MKLTLALLTLTGALSAQNPLTDTVKTRYGAIKQSLIEAAEVVPEDAYTFRLTPAQRTFGEWIAHTAGGNYNYCAAIKAEKAPEAAQAAAKATSKADLVKAIRDSFTYCDVALEGMTDLKALAAIDMAGKKVYPAQGMVNLVASANEHYGNMVGYMRAKGVTPPSTARAAKKK
jgi:uncharacterized damage-inducible protein DinB